MSNNEITSILSIVLSVMMCVLVTLIIVFFFLKSKDKKKKKSFEEEELTDKDNKKKTEVKENKITMQYDIHDIKNFMEFEDVQDNMIVVKKGKKYLMVIECKGVNYDLMSEMEKVGVEEGFQQFLNTLRHPIQLYIQTRTINLENSVSRYKDRVDKIESEYRSKQIQYSRMMESNQYTREQMQKAYYEITRLKNLTEYGKDIIQDTEKLSLNKNVLSKTFFIVLPYYVENLEKEQYDKKETASIAFTDLYTNAQSIIRTLSGCSISGRILNSKELVELLYVSYNRDDAEILNIDKLMEAGFDNLYSVGEDIIEKKERAIDNEINRKAYEMAGKAVESVKSKNQERVEEKEASIDELARKMAEIVLETNSETIGYTTAKEAIEEIRNSEGGE